MADIITLGTEAISYRAWRSIYHGANIKLAPAKWAGIEQSAGVIATVVERGAPVYGVNTGFGKLASMRIGNADLAHLQENIVLSHAAGVGEPLSHAVSRLVLALKINSLAQGASGIQCQTLQRLIDALERDLVPVIPGQGSVGASGDLAPLAHLTAALFFGQGEIFQNGAPVPAMAVLEKSGLKPLTLGPKEGLALLNGTQVSTALALAGLFGAECVFHAGLITGALSTDAAKGSDGPFDARIHKVRGQPGQITVADTLRKLLSGSAIRASHLVDDDRIQDPYCLRCQPQVMGACLDLLRSTAATLVIEANGVTDNPLVFSDTGEVVSGGNFHAEPVAFAADIIALALCEIGSIAERRVAMLTDPALSRLPAFLTPKPGLNSGFMIPQVTAAALVAENRQRAMPASVDSIPTSANQEDHVSMATHGARRTLVMAENTVQIIAIELLAAAQGCDFHAPLLSSAPLENVRRLLRGKVPMLQDDRFFAPDIAAAADLIRSGAVAEAAGLNDLPAITGPAE